MQKYLKVMLLSAEYVGLNRLRRFSCAGFQGRRTRTRIIRAKKRGVSIRFRTHNLGMSGTTLTLDGQKEVHILFCYARIISWAGFLLAAYGKQKCMVAKGALHEKREQEEPTPSR